MEIELREARRGDELAVAEVHVRAWQEAYAELMPAEFLAGLDPAERVGRYEFEAGPTTVVAVEIDGRGARGAPGGTPLSRTWRFVRDPPDAPRAAEWVRDVRGLTGCRC